MQFPIRQLRRDEFPPLLREIPDRPSVLYIRGSLPKDERVYLCVVGSRACSPYARRVTQKLLAGLASYPVTIVSGLAIGIDAEAHKAALEVGLPTVAVLPSSVDERSLYPSQNKPLAHRILERGGALISEEKGPHKAMIHNFPQRNRVMAGMSRVTLIVEASEKSGTLITARLALDYNREVMAVPHELGSARGAGANWLLREGATLVRNSDDILEALGIARKEAKQEPLPMDLTTHEAALFELLDESLVRDELIERSELSAQEVGVALSSLLIRGLIIERLGKIERV